MEWLEVAAWVWGVSSALFVAAERTVMRVWDPKDPWTSVGAYSVLLAVSPALVALSAAVLPVGAVVHARRFVILNFVRGAAADPLRVPVEKWPSETGLFLSALIARRAAYDPRLRGVDVGDWPGYAHWEQPEAALLECADAHRDLAAAGLPDEEIWHRLDEFVGWGSGPAPTQGGIHGYLTERISRLDPRLPELGDAFLAGHVDACLRWLDAHGGRRGGWPPKEWLRRRVGPEAIEMDGIGENPVSGRPAAVRHCATRDGRDYARMKVRMLPGDEVWEYSSPGRLWQAMMGRAGYALVRKGEIVASFVTCMN